MDGEERRRGEPIKTRYAICTPGPVQDNIKQPFLNLHLPQDDAETKPSGFPHPLGLSACLLGQIADRTCSTSSISEDYYEVGRPESLLTRCRRPPSTPETSKEFTTLVSHRSPASGLAWTYLCILQLLASAWTRRIGS